MWGEWNMAFDPAAATAAYASGGHRLLFPVIYALIGKMVRVTLSDASMQRP
jgi:hypothetical protein